MSGRTIPFQKDALATLAWLLLASTVLAGGSSNNRSTVNPRTGHPGTPVATPATPPRIRLVTSVVTHPIPPPVTVVVQVGGAGQPAVATAATDSRSVVVQPGGSVTLSVSVPVSQAGPGPVLITQK